MGLYGAVTKDAVAAAPGGHARRGLPGVTYDNEVVLFYSDVDPVSTTRVAAGNLHHADPLQGPVVPGERRALRGDTAADRRPSRPARPTRRTLLRFLSAASETHVPTLQGLHMTIHAEDGFRYNWQDRR